jgi:hypothetical protein
MGGDCVNVVEGRVGAREREEGRGEADEKEGVT